MKRLLFFGLLVVVLSGCAQPATPGVFGKVEKDGQPVSDNEVVLVMTVNGSDSETRKGQTDANGQYAFEEVTPGTYYLITSIVEDDTAGCSTSSPGFHILNIAMASKDTGAPIAMMSMATNSDDPFEVKAKDHVVKEIVFNCK